MDSFMDRDEEYFPVRKSTTSDDESAFNRDSSDINDREITSDYNTNHGLSDDMFLKIQEEMRANSQNQTSSDEPLNESKQTSESDHSKWE